MTHLMSHHNRPLAWYLPLLVFVYTLSPYTTGILSATSWLWI